MNTTSMTTRRDSPRRIGLCGAAVMLCWLDGAAAQAEEAIQPSPLPECRTTLRILEQPADPALKRGDPGTENIRYGIEGGCVIKQDGIYHLFTSEIVGEPRIVKMKLGHWTSSDRLHWTRQSTCYESSADRTGSDPRASLWAPMAIFDERERCWNLFYVAYRSKPNDKTGWYDCYDGRIYRALSNVTGREGIGGPYKDVGVVLEPDAQSQAWEGLQGVDSFFPYETTGKWLGFYGSAQTQKPMNPTYPKWCVGLAESPTLAGPWTRRPEGNPVLFETHFVENPVVTRLTSGRYVAVFVITQAIGYADSPDGIHWSAAKSLRPDVRCLNSPRTALGLIAESDGTFTLFYTAFDHVKRKDQFGCLGVLKIELKEQP
jgi:hypothetical protein